MYGPPPYTDGWAGYADDSPGRGGKGVWRDLRPLQPRASDSPVNSYFYTNVRHARILGRIWTDAAKLCSFRTETEGGAATGAVA
jgi:hypothetical protein